MSAGPMNARILYWGIEGSGKSTNLRMIHAKLRANNRAELREAATRLDPTVVYEVLPIQLGDVGGIPTEIEIVTVPDGSEQAPTRKQLLDEVSGVVLVIDSSPARADENVAAREELEESLASYGRDLADLPVVVQYNKRDLVDDNVIEALHRRLALPTAAVFEAVAIDGTNVLQTLTTISKRVVKNLRDAHALTAQEPAAPESLGQSAPVYDEEALAQRSPAPAEAAGEPAPAATPPEPAEVERTTPAQASTRLLESAMEAEDLESEEEQHAYAEIEGDTQAVFDQTYERLAEEAKSDATISLGADLRIVSVGTVTRTGDRTMRVPLVLGDADGATASLAFTISLDPFVDEDTE